MGPGRYSISSRSAPTESERNQLTARADDLRLGLIPATKEEVRTSLLKFMAGMDLKMTADDLDEMVSMFVASLMGLPLWAIRQALLNWMQGTIAGANPRFTPKPPELRIEANRIAAPFQRELGSIEAGLSASVEQVPTQSERDAAVARWHDEIRPTMGHADVTEDLSEKRRQEALDENRRFRAREAAHAGLADGHDMTLDMRRALYIPTQPRAKVPTDDE